jgi:acetoin utilization deacetylase AcuC-like enzyme
MTERTRLKVKVFYHDRMVADAGSFSKSPAKPKHVFAQWLKSDWIEPCQFEPATVSQLCRAHDERYVRGVLDSRLSNGFGNKLETVARSLPYTSGAMIAAAREAMANGKVACAPVSGFHHAGYDHGGGFCTFNGLIVTAQALLDEGLAKRVGILDFDQHYGDGTDAILAKLDLHHAIAHYTAGQHYWKPEQARGFLNAIPAIVGRMKDCGVILYQAGADPHVDDPLGGWLTSKELAKRDALVFETAHGLGVPVAWNLAGGYQEPLRKVIDIHVRTMEACVKAYSSVGLKAYQ